MYECECMWDTYLFAHDGGRIAHLKPYDAWTIAVTIIKWKP